MATSDTLPAGGGSSVRARLGGGWRPWTPWLLAGFGFVATLVGLVILGARLGDPPSIFLALAGATLLLGLERLYSVSRALVRSPIAAAILDEGGGVGGSSRELREERTRVLKAIKELEFDFAVGKLEPSDYEQIVGAYKLRAIELGRALSTPRRAQVSPLGVPGEAAPEVSASVEPLAAEPAVGQGVTS